MRKHTWDVVLIVLVLGLATILWRLNAHYAQLGAAGDFNAVETRAGLGRHVRGVSLDNVTLGQALDALSRSTGARILSSPTIASRPQPVHAGSYAGFRGRTWQSPISAQFNDLSLRAALDVLINQTEGQFPLPLTYAARDDGTILVGADDEVPLVVRTYDLSDLLSLMGAPEASSGDTTGDSARSRLIMALLDVVPLDAWPAPMQFVGNRLVVVQNEGRLRAVDSVVRELSAIRQPWPAGSRVQIQLPGDINE